MRFDLVIKPRMVNIRGFFYTTQKLVGTGMYYRTIFFNFGFHI